MRILVADDDPVYRDLLGGLLAESQFEAVPAVDGAEAWEILQRPGAPAIAVLDWKMPRMDGFEVCMKVRQASAGPLPYILLMTSHSSRDDLLRVLIAGADDYLLKPFEPLDLKIRLRSAIRILNLEQQLKLNGQATGAGLA